jgi:hypothetical protein
MWPEMVAEIHYMLKSKQKSKGCPEGKYWVPPYKRKRIDKNGKPYVEEVKGYCASYHSPFHMLAEEEKCRSICSILH